MDELDLFRNFRRGVAARSEDAQRRAFALLRHEVDREQRRGRRVLRRIGRRATYRALALAALAGATATALFISTPWSNSPTFLERARAALTPPAGMILHEKWEETTTTSTDPACTVEHGPSEIWIDETPPYRYRLLVNDFPPDSAVGPRALVCASGTAAELGGTFDPAQTLMFVPPNTLSEPPFRFTREPADLDPVSALREAISAGTAHVEGKMQLDGRTVERIRIDPPSDCPDPPCPRESSYAYVDPETFYPVQIESPNGFIARRGSPLGPVVRFHEVGRIVTYEYLPRTAANLALTDIRARHPNATGP
jgi:hypothetical protein